MMWEDGIDDWGDSGKGVHDKLEDFPGYENKVSKKYQVSESKTGGSMSLTEKEIKKKKARQKIEDEVEVEQKRKKKVNEDIAKAGKLIEEMENMKLHTILEFDHTIIFRVLTGWIYRDPWRKQGHDTFVPSVTLATENVPSKKRSKAKKKSKK